MYRTFRNPSIWREMDRLQRDMNRLFNQYSPTLFQPAPSYPALNIWAAEDSLFISAEMPGVRGEDIDIQVERDTLTISGERSSDEVPEEAQFHRKERSFGKFSRSVQLPFGIDVQKVEAHLMNGVLNITLQRVEAEKPKKISIKA